MTPAALLAALSGDLDNALVASTPGGIEWQEAAGQARLVADETLPIEIDYGTRAQFEKMGIVFGARPSDPHALFIPAKLPAGWKKVATNHSMWSHLVDDKGRERASIFYKAAFYDTRASMSPTCRYRKTVEPQEGWEKYQRRAGALFCARVYRQDAQQAETVVWQSELLDHDERGVETQLQEQARAWLETNLPSWQDPLAYWD